MNSLQKDLQNLFSDGWEKVRVIADFDGTLTKEYVGGKKLPSIISVLRDNPQYLSSDYQEKAKALYATYALFEKDTTLPLAFRKEKMKEWWQEHYVLLAESGLKQEHIKQIASSGLIELREGAREFLQLMYKQDIPLTIFSASGLGEAIYEYLQQQNLLFSNIHFMINRFSWNGENILQIQQEPIIHSLNKDETAIIHNSDIADIVKARANILLLGNGLGDLGMSAGSDPEKQVTIGFLDQEEKEKEKEFLGKFDHTIVGGYIDINAILSQILK